MFDNLSGIDQISLPKNALLKFVYGGQPDDPLYIHSGATAIKWNYTLNTQSTPTIGGEVVQILSAMVGPLTITGQTAGIKTTSSGKLNPTQIPGWKDFGGKEAYGPNHELRDIVAWFLNYMTRAGTDNQGNAFRSERAIKFMYPERGWDFYIMPTQLTGFRYDKMTVAPEWSITAEIVSDNALDRFAGITMSSFTDELLSTNTKIQGQIGLSAFAATTTETANPNFGQAGDFGSTNPFLNPALGIDANAALKRMGDNFQGLVAAWSQGDFAHFGFGAMLDNNALPKDVNQAYEKLFGTTLLGSLPGWSGGGTGQSTGSSAGGSYTYSGSNAQDKVAVVIANEFSDKGVPPELGVAVALHESALNPDQTQYGCNEAACGIGLFQVNGDGTGEVGSHRAQIVQAGLHRSYGSAKGNIIGTYTLEMQAKDAAQYFAANKPSDIHGTDSLDDNKLAEWAYAAQKGVGFLTNTSSGGCTPKFSNDLVQARQILQQLTVTNATGLRASVLAWCSRGDNAQNHTYSESCDRKVENYPPGHWPSSMDCSSYVALIYCWATKNNHKYATSGTSFNYTNTATIAQTFKSNRIAAHQARAGDILLFLLNPPSGSPLASLDHAMILLEDWNGDQTRMSAMSNPSTPGPNVITYGSEAPYHPGYTSCFYSVLP